MSLSKISSPTNEQMNFVNHYCAKFLDRGLTTNLLGLGRDDLLLIRIITSLTRNQAIGVDQFYRTMNPQNQSLPAKLESINGSYGHLLSALTQSHESFHASLLKTALEGISTDTNLINEIMTLLSHQEVNLIADAFNRKYGMNLRDRFQGKLNKNHFQLVTKLLHNGRSEDQNIDETLAVEQAQTLNTILSKTTMLGSLTDEATVELIDFVLTFSYSQAQVIKKQFELQNPNQPSAESLIHKRIGGPLQEAFLLLFDIPTAVYARKIKEACTNGPEDAIWRIIGGHNVDYVNQIAEEYERNFNADMRMIIRTKTSGRFQDALVSYLQFCPHPMDHSDESLLTYLLTLDVFILTHFSVDVNTLLTIICNRSKGHLEMMDKIYRQTNNGQTLLEYISIIKGKERRESKRFLKYVVLSNDEVDVRCLRRALNLETNEEGEDQSGVDKRAIVESLCGKSPERLVAARELYERLYDATFVQTLQKSLESDPTLSLIVSALVSHNRHEAMDRIDYDGGSAEALATEIESYLNDLSEENLQELVMAFLTHSQKQLTNISQIYEQTFHKNLEREIIRLIPNLIGVALNALTFTPATFLARQIHSSINDPDTINRLIGGSDKSLLQEMQHIYKEHFRSDVLVDLSNAYPGQTEYVSNVTAWITQSGLPFSV